MINIKQMTGDIINIQNPIPILQQPKSKIITNPLIPDAQATIIIDDPSVKSNTTTTLHSNISNSFVAVIDDLHNKPSHIPWSQHVVTTLHTNDRYAYLGYLFILIACFVLIIKYT
jgi:hypothetical protein